MRPDSNPVARAGWRALAISGLTLALSAPLSAGLDIPDLPLELGAVVPSNLMYILDDSGSMMWDVMPDERVHFSMYYLFPHPAKDPYGGDGPYNRRVPHFGDGNLFNYYLRSAHNNTVFYDPAITYRPWAKHDGTSYGNASPTAAPYNPAYAAAGTLDLTVRQDQSAAWIHNVTNDDPGQAWWAVSGCNDSDPCKQKFWPITFYVYKGSGPATSASSYVKYQIRGSQGYRKELPDGSESAVSSFTWPGGITRTIAEERQNFANWFSYYRSRILAARAGTSIAFAGLSADNFRVGFRTINGANAMDIAVDGTFSGTNRSAWFDRLFSTSISMKGTPLRNSLKSVGSYYEDKSNDGPWGPAPQLECRRSFAILTSDGYWNGGSPGVGNADGNSGDRIDGPDGQSYTYSPEAPYEDGYGNTLADVAMAFWKKDLRPDLANRIRPTPTNPAFWQHMSTFTIGLGVRGTLNPDSDLPALTDQTRSWPDPTSSDPAKIDDMWHAAVNGRGLFVAAQNAQQFAAGLKKALDAIGRDGAVMNVAVTSTSLVEGSKVFRARYDGTWGGDLAAYPVSVETNRVSATPSWTAAAQLDARAPSERRIYTHVGGALAQLTPGSSAMASHLGVDLQVYDFLLGERSGELPAGPLRSRSTVLGDIVYSSPVYVRETGTVYVGANDGMLHAFDAADGAELFAYLPTHAYPRLGELADPDYSHRFFVDGETVVSTKAQGGGKNILVGSLGRGGKALYALDVSDPTAPAFEWEFADADLGHVIGKPVIVELNNGKSAVMVGNGYNSDDDEAFLFLIALDSGSLIKKIGTGAGSSAVPNGLAQPTGWDADRDGTVDTVYAGDLHGNMWRFDLGGTGSGSWKTDGKLFEAVDAAGKAQAITGAPAVAINPANGERWVVFGTGRFLTYDDKTDKDVQSWYGVIDDGKNTVERDGLYLREVEYVTTSAGRRVRVFSVPEVEVAKTKKGWLIDWTLPGGGAEGERVVSRTQYIGGVVVVSSIIPENDPCLPGGRSWLNQVSPFIGHAADRTFFDINDDMHFDERDLIARDEQELPVNSAENPDEMMREVAVIGERAFTGGGDEGINLAVPTGRISWHEIVAD
ncbi:MAG TPA: PilC/PilY family type IV pilus protein [Rhodocyclaceae bacterium]|nr:PilC/PilY family type IV pilus protein [Rhodocyclaceae bacterium]